MNSISKCDRCKLYQYDDAVKAVYENEVRHAFHNAEQIDPTYSKGATIFEAFRDNLCDYCTYQRSKISA